MKKLVCKKCGYSWYPRLLRRLPRQCPYCKNPNWNKESKK